MANENKTPVKKSFLHSSIVLRLLASVVFIPCFIIITLRGGFHFLALVDIVIFVGMLEFYGMMEAKGIKPYKAIGIICGIALSWYVYFQNGVYSNLFLTLALLSIMTLELTRRDGLNAIYHISTTMLGVFYIAFLASHLVLLRELPLSVGLDYSIGSSFVFLAFMITWACDTGAYIVGTLIGKHSLLPRVSEKKTIEGSLGGLVFAIGGALLGRAWFADFLGLQQAVILALAAGVICQIGDLVESMIKRDADVKDTSGLIPGHGGVLDRFDGLFFTAPLLFYYLKFVVLQ
jgi:phosphatidate cytidylyltransferase